MRVRIGEMAFVVALMLCATVRAESESKQARSASAAANRAIKWLIKQQAGDGGWHSATYGNMRGGASITAHVLYTFAKLPAEQSKPYRKQLQRAVDFLRKGIAKKGFVTPPDGSLDYPAYATAMTLIAVRQLKLELPESEQKQLVSFLLKEQRTEANGYKPSDDDYGGWDLMAGSGITGAKTSTNISITTVVLEALKPYRGKRIDRARKLAIGWANKCRNPNDGGFFFHPERNHPGNKAEWLDKKMKSPRSYGTPTCDGIRLLLNAGVKKSDKRIQSATAWLNKQLKLKAVPGFEKVTKPSKSWEDGLRYYYYSRLAGLLPLIDAKKSKQRAEQLRAIIIKEQQKDGSWKNKSARMREDDPLIATCFLLQALAAMEANE